MLLVNCPGCNSPANSPWAHENGFTAVRCADCRLIYVNPRPVDSEIAEANRLGVHGDLDVRTHRATAKIRRYERLIRRFYPDEPARWLDVGAGYGETVEAVKAAFPNAAVKGVEPMQPKAVAGRALGLDIADTLADAGTGFDVISLINVYSHVPDFLGFGAMLVAKLNPGGSLFIETGNVADLERREEFADKLYLPDHLVFAGEVQLRNALERLGLTVTRCEALPTAGLRWRFKQGFRRSRFRRLVVRASKH